MSERMVVLDAEYHHIWRKGDVVIWDNRCPYHRAAGDWKTVYIAGLVAKQGRLRSVEAG